MAFPSVIPKLVGEALQPARCLCGCVRIVECCDPCRIKAARLVHQRLVVTAPGGAIKPENLPKALAAVDDPSRIVPWVDAGREPHAGDPISAADLHRILVAAREAGLQNFLFHNHCHLTGSEWAVVSNLCGEPWYDGKPGYHPPDGLAWETVSLRGLTK